VGIDNLGKTHGRAMADKNSLGFVGFLFGGVTFAVTLIAFVVVQNHIEGRYVLDEPVTAAQLMVQSH
jgi:hypothetical protein